VPGCLSGNVRQPHHVLANEIAGHKAEPIWVKHGINAWMTAAGIEDGPVAALGFQKGDFVRWQSWDGGTGKS
jgi:hypothetical protein